MDSLYQTLNKEWETSTSEDRKKLLDQVLKDYSKDYFELFGISKDLDMEFIKDAIRDPYIKLALLLHPDKNKDKLISDSAVELFKLVNTAYETLLDVDKKRVHLATLAPKPSKSTNTSQHNFTRESNSTYSFTSFSSTRSNSSSSSSSNHYRRDIKAGEIIKSNLDDITIVGDVYGMVINKLGNIKIDGDVKGTVKNNCGKIKISGSVYGTVTNSAGNNKIKGSIFGTVINNCGKNSIDGDVYANATVSNNSGNNQITGDAYGTVENNSGENHVDGRSGANVYSNESTTNETSDSSHDENVFVFGNTGSGNTFFNATTVIGSMRGGSFTINNNGFQTS